MLNIVREKMDILVVKSILSGMDNWKAKVGVQEKIRMQRSKERPQRHKTY